MNEQNKVKLKIVFFFHFNMYFFFFINLVHEKALPEKKGFLCFPLNELTELNEKKNILNLHTQLKSYYCF